MPIQLECPSCKQPLQVPDNLAGKQGSCVHCGQRVTVPAAGRASSSSVNIPLPSPTATAPHAAGAPLQVECPGCRQQLAVPPEFAGRVGKCPHCGHRLTIPGPPKASAGGLSGTLFEATPESMLREIFRRQQSAMLLVFPTPGDGNYDLSNIPDGELKCIATEDINQARFAQLVGGFIQRFAPRKKGQAAAPSPEELLFELKGDKLGMPLEEFKTKYAGGAEGGQRLPICSDTAWGANKASLHSEQWHLKAGIITARVDAPAEDNSPTVAGVKTELLLYQFIDGKLFRISAWFPTDQFHSVSDAAAKKYGPATRESQKPRQLVWDNPLATVHLTRGSVHPPEPSLLQLEHKQLTELAASRAPTAAADI